MRAVIGLGSNVGSREALLQCAVDLLAIGDGIDLEAVSHVWSTVAVGPVAQGDFLNAAALVETALAPAALLAHMQSIETRLGRERTIHQGPRTIDLDLLWTDGPAVSEPALVLPHPALADRAFALVPMLELVPDAGDPRTGEPYAPRAVVLGLPSPQLPHAWRPRTTDAHGRDRAADLAILAETIAGARRDPDTVSLAVEHALDVDVRGCSDAERRQRFGDAVRELLVRERFDLRRAVVLTDDADVVRASLFGAPSTVEKTG